MKFTSIIDAKTRAAAITAAVRTTSQSLSAGLGLLFVGGSVATATAPNVFAWDWSTLGGGLIAVVLLALIAGVKAALGIIGGGIPKQYIAAAPTATTTRSVAKKPAAVVEPQLMRG
jgi:hypothetical protein